MGQRGQQSSQCLTPQISQTLDVLGCIEQQQKIDNNRMHIVHSEPVPTLLSPYCVAMTMFGSVKALVSGHCSLIVC